MNRLIISGLFIAAAVASLAGMQTRVGRLGKTIPKGTTSSSGSSADVTSEDLTFLGYYRVPLVDDNGNTIFLGPGGNTAVYPAASMYKTGGVNHFFISTEYNAPSAGAPVEFTEPGVYDSNGNCVSGTCPGANYATAPRISSANVIANWGENKDGSSHDAFGGLIDKWWNLSTGALDSGCGDANPCQLQWGTVTPNGDWLVSYSAGYGNHSLVAEDTGTTSSSGYVIGSILVHFIAANTGGNRSTAAYGPFTFKDGVSTPPPVSGYGSFSGFNWRSVGTYSARWWTVMPDGSMGWGSGDAGQTQYYGSQGPTLQVAAAASWPTPATATSATTRILSTQNWLHFWSLSGYFDPVTGALSGQTNWAFRMPGSPYAYEGNTQGVPTAINPAMNAGIGTTSDYDRVNGAVCIDTATKHGCIEFLDTSTNHNYTGGITDCSNAHRYYYPSAGSFCPVHNCDVGGSNTGPVTNHQEARWLFYSWTDMQAVKNGSKTDYTVEPIDTMFPSDTRGIPATTGVYQVVEKRAVPIGYDKDTNNLYVEFPSIDQQGCCEFYPVIAVYHVAQ